MANFELKALGLIVDFPEAVKGIHYFSWASEDDMEDLIDNHFRTKNMKFPFNQSPIGKYMAHMTTMNGGRTREETIVYKPYESIGELGQMAHPDKERYIHSVAATTGFFETTILESYSLVDKLEEHFKDMGIQTYFSQDTKGMRMMGAFHALSRAGYDGPILAVPPLLVEQNK
jgi:hypothetical protein